MKQSASRRAASTDTRREAASVVSAEEPSGPAPVEDGGTAPPDPVEAVASVEDRSEFVGGPPWSRRSARMLLAVAAVLGTAVVCHLGMLFLSITPANGITHRYQRVIDGYVYPEFGQYWQLFAPNPLRAEVHVAVRVARARTAGGQGAVTGPWIDLTAQDIAATRHNPFPSHVTQNMLRRAWNFYQQAHTGTAPHSVAGPLSAEYLKRIAVQRVGLSDCSWRPARMQFRISAVPVQRPPWDSRTSAAASRPAQALLPWWPVAGADCEGL